MNDLNQCNRQQLLNQIFDQMNHYSDEELMQVERVLESIRSSKEGKLHFFGNFVGIRVVSNELVEMDLGYHNANSYGAAQGGAISTLADIAIGYCILSKVAKDKKVVTLELKLNYIKPGLGELLTARPTILHHGNNTAVGTCSIYNNSGELVAQAQGTFYLVREKKF